MTEETNSIRSKMHEIIFEADTPAGKWFDINLLFFIMGSIIVVMLESVAEYQDKYGHIFLVLEWVFTIYFTVEYILRLYCVLKPLRYATSFFGVIDLLAVLPSYLSLFIAGTHFFIVIRALRLLRVFRIFKLGHFMKEGKLIMEALKASKARIMVFLFFVLVMVVIIGSAMYLIEGNQGSGFTSIPRSVYWAVVTLTTVGYGDITPVTPIGQFLSAAVMILGYSVIAVPTGIVSAELIRPMKVSLNTQACPFCGKEGHDDDADFCNHCGGRLVISDS